MPIMHVSVDIRGILEWPDQRKLRKMFRNSETGKSLTQLEARDFLYDCLAKGWRVLPIGEACEGFDYQTGCPGHEVAE